MAFDTEFAWAALRQLSKSLKQLLVAGIDLRAACLEANGGITQNLIEPGIATRHCVSRAHIKLAQHRSAAERIELFAGRRD